MDFLALPRRDLQALCKRNGVRANMTNVAMAEALAALPKVDGIEEYVKEPVAVPVPEVKAAAADEQQTAKQGSTLPRGRRVPVKYVKEPVAVPAPEVKAAAAADEQQTEKQGSTLPPGRRVPVKAPETDGGKEDEKRESAKEDAPVLGLGRRGPSRRARPAPAVATSMVVPVGKAEEAEDKQDGSKEDPPAPVVGRRAASRPGRPELAAESAAAGALEEQMKKDGSPSPRGRRGAVKSSEPIRSDDFEEVEEKELKRKAGTDGAPALGVGRRGASRRARPAPALAEPAGKVIEEQKAPPIPRGRPVKTKSTEPIKLNDGEDKKAATKPEEEEEDVPALGVGRRGASRCVRRAPAVAEVAGKVAAEDEPRALIPRGHCIRVKSPEVIRLDDSEDEEKEDTELDEKDDEAPTIGVGRRGASRCAPAPVEAPITRRRAAVGVTEEAVPTRAPRQRKPTMKAAAAAEEKALPKVTRRKAVKKTIAQEEEQEKPHEAVPASVSDVGCDNSEDTEDASGPQKREQKQKDEGVAIIEDEILMAEAPAQELLVTDQESMDHSTLQGQQLGVEKCPSPLAGQEDSPIMGLVSMATEQAADKDDGANVQVGEGSNESLDKGLFKEILDAGEEMEMVSTIQGLQGSPTEEHIEEVVTDDANHENEIGSSSEVPHGTEETREANTEDDLVSQNKEDMNINELQADLADRSVLVDCSGNIKLFVEEETNEVNTEDGVSFQEKGDVPVDMALPDAVAGTSEANTEDDLVSQNKETSEANTEDDLVSQNEEDISIDELQADLADGSVLVDCSGSIKLFVEEETNEFNTEDRVSFQEKGDVPDTVAEAITFGCSNDISCVEMEKSADITSKMSESQAALEEDGEGTNSYADICHADKPSEVVIGDSVSQVTVTDSEIVLEEKVVVITGDMPWSTAVMHGDIEEDQVQTIFIHGDQVVAADYVPEVKIIDCEVEEKTAMIIDEQQQSTVTMDEDVVDNHFETDVIHVDEQKEVVTIDEVPEITGTDDVLVEVKAAVTVPQSTGKVDEGGEEDQSETAFVHADQVLTADSVLDLKITECEPIEDRTTLIIDEKQQSTVTMDEDVADDHFETDAGHAVEQKKVVTADEVPELTGTNDEIVDEDEAVVIAEEVPQSTGTDEDVVEDWFQTFFVHADQVATFKSVSDLEITYCEEKTTLIVDDKQQSTVTTDESVVGGHSETDELKEVATDDNMSQLTGTEGEVVEKDKAAVITQEGPHCTGTMDEIGFVQDDDELTNAITTDNMPVINEIDGAAKNTFVCDIPQELNVAKESNDHIIQASLDNVTESLCKNIVTMEPAVSVSDGSEKNTSELEAMQEEKGVKAAKNMDLSKLSIRQLRTKIKEKLNAKKNKEAKRVALARVDENVCRSHSKWQQQNLNLQQH